MKTKSIFGITRWLSLVVACAILSQFTWALPDGRATAGPAVMARGLGESEQESGETGKPRSQSSSAGKQEDHGRTTSGVAARGSISHRVPDSVLVNQDGKSVRFYRDLVLERVVVVSFIFTSCTLVCPMLGDSFSKLQDALGERLGRDVFLVTITTDPKTDTPERLRDWGNRFGSKPGWTIATGDVKDIDELLFALTGTRSGQSEHSPGVLILNDRTGVIVRDYGLGDPARLIKAIDATR
jgi:protein SCO1/2